MFCLTQLLLNEKGKTTRTKQSWKEGTTIVLGYKDVINEKPAKEIRNTLLLSFEQDNF